MSKWLKMVRLYQIRMVVGALHKEKKDYAGHQIRIGVSKLDAMKNLNPYTVLKDIFEAMTEEEYQELLNKTYASDGRNAEAIGGDKLR